MDPLGVSQIISSPKKEIVTHARARTEVEAPPTPAKEGIYTPNSASSSASHFTSRQQEKQSQPASVPQWPATPSSGASSSFTNQQSSHGPTHYSVSSPWSAAGPSSLQQQQQAASSSALRSPGSSNSPGHPRSPYAREPPAPSRAATGLESDDDNAPIVSAARYDAQQAQLQAQARARNGAQQSREFAERMEALREKDRIEGYVRIRVIGMERNKKDLWVKMEATVRLICSFWASLY